MTKQVDFRRRSVAAGVALAMGLGFISPLAALAQSADSLVHEVINHELEAGKNDHTHWLYINEDLLHHQTKATIETPHGTVDRLLLINGRPLTASEEKQEDDRIRRLLSSPDAQQKLRQDQRADSKQTEDLFKMLPTAWSYKIASRNGDEATLDFIPNPNFNPPSNQLKALHQMSGTLIVNTQQLRLMSISGRLLRDVKFGWFGILGYLTKGGTFAVKQSEIEPDYWKITNLKVNMNGKALFFKTISVHQDEAHSHFERVPDTLTLEQAEDRLREVHFP